MIGFQQNKQVYDWFTSMTKVCYRYDKPIATIVQLPRFHTELFNTVSLFGNDCQYIILILHFISYSCQKYVSSSYIDYDNIHTKTICQAEQIY